MPRRSSENQKYIPLGYFDSINIAGDTCATVPNATLYHFVILHSIMHLSWIKQISVRMKSDISYSMGIVYNNFPWRENPTEKQLKKFV
ncbi:type IIL restriction-modification enzyme MmeI [Flavobacterium xueshanense]